MSHCIAMRCVALRCVALRCVALRCIALHLLYCIVFRSQVKLSIIKKVQKYTSHNSVHYRASQKLYIIQV